MVVTAQLEPLRLTGRLDASNVADVRSQLNDIIETHPTGNVVLDLSGVHMVDATGLGLLAATHVRLSRDGRRLVLRGCTGPIHRVLAVTRLSRVLRVEPTTRPA